MKLYKKPIFISKNAFLNYFKRPNIFWFLDTEEIEDLFKNTKAGEDFENLEEQDLLEFLREIDSQENLFLENCFKLNQIKNKKLKDRYREIFSISDLFFHDQSENKEDRTQFLVDVLKNNHVAFLFKPKFTVGNIQANPTALYKYKDRIYLIEHEWSSTLKRESMGKFIFYHYFFNNLLEIKIDQYLISYLSAEAPKDTELIIKFGNSLPYDTKEQKPPTPYFPKLKNINTFFDLGMEYKNSLYSILFNREDFDKIVNDPWPKEYFVDAEKVVSELQEFMLKPQRETDFEQLCSNFLRLKEGLIEPEATWFKKAVQNVCINFDFSGKLVNFHTCLKKLLKQPKERQEHTLNYITNLKFIKLPEDQDYVVFEKAVPKFEAFKRKRIKIYYDFESLSVPFPILKGIKPYTQIVLQLSLIKFVDGKEEKVTNLIIDPLDLKIEDFKQIVDSIYTDEIDVAYVVYNKGFENTRLKEMASFIDEQEYLEKVISIIDRTVDLADWFSFGNNPHIIHKKLKGFHSIKKVTTLISKEIEEKTGTVQYSELTRCKNGVMAQALLLSRFLATKSMDSHNWEKNKSFMYAYCENDVRSMIAVELLIEQLVSQNKNDYYSEKEYMDLKKRFKNSFKN